MSTTLRAVRIRGSALSFADACAIALAVCGGLWLFVISAWIVTILAGGAILAGLAGMGEATVTRPPQAAETYSDPAGLVGDRPPSE